MKSSINQEILPVQETIAHKTDVLDWSQVATQRCEMEFRTDVRLGPTAAVTVFLQLVTQTALVSLVAWIISWPIGLWIAPLLDRGELAVLAIGVGVVWAISAAVRGQTEAEDDRVPPVEPAMLGRVFLPPLAWQVITLSRGLDQLANAFIYYIMVTLPAAVFWFDWFTTHAVHWMTAKMGIGPATKRTGRIVWSWRLLPLPGNYLGDRAEDETEPDPAFDAVVRAAAGYRWGPLWLAAAVLVPSVFVATTNPDGVTATIGMQLVLGISFGLLVAVLLFSSGDPRMAARFFWILAHWFYYGWQERLPPWVHHSPCGRWRRRQLTMLLLVGLLSIPITWLAAHSFSSLIAPTDARVPNAQAVKLSLDDADGAQPPPSTDKEPATMPWIWIAPTVLVAFFLPAIDFCLIGLLLTGRVISAYYDAFES